MSGAFVLARVDAEACAWLFLSHYSRHTGVHAWTPDFGEAIVTDDVEVLKVWRGEMMRGGQEPSAIFDHFGDIAERVIVTDTDPA